MEFSYSVEELCAMFPEADVEGSSVQALVRIAALDEAGPGDVSFLGNARYAGKVPQCQASALLLPRGYAGNPDPDQVYLRLDDPSVALARLCERITAEHRPVPAPGIHPSAVVDASARVDPAAHVGPLCVLGAGATIGPRSVLVSQVTVGAHVRIGADCTLRPRVVLEDDTVLGDRVLIHAGAVIGADGFGYASGPEGHRKLPQIGRVVIGNDVEIGANTTIDRARFAETSIGDGTKIDNLVQIGHNCVIGRHCVICALVGLSGSTRIGDFVTMAGQSAAAGHLTIGDRCMIGGQAGVTKTLAPGSVVTGTPVRPLREQRRIDALTGRLPELLQRLRKLEDGAGAPSLPPRAGAGPDRADRAD
jgi:UDP-3-O-[3-hydroxymyristoyl] glucosamine N-acyltransferase